MTSGAILATAAGSWRAERPFLGGVLLIVAGLIVGYVPIQFTLELILIGGTYTAIGLVFAALISLTGVFALLRPDLSTILGIAGVAFSILSVVGALGGLLVGLLIGLLGSNLLIAWEPPAKRGDREGHTAGAGTGTGGATTVTAGSGTDGGWLDAVGGVGTSTPTAASSASAPTGGGGSGASTSFGWHDGPTGRGTARAGPDQTDPGTSFAPARTPSVDDDGGSAAADDAVAGTTRDEADDDHLKFDWENET